MKISLRIETKNHDEIAQRAKHEQELHQADTFATMTAMAFRFLGELADRAERHREAAREEARRWGAAPQEPPLQ